MLLQLTLPRINPYMVTAIIDRLYLAPGAAVTAGVRLLDLTIDLTAAAPHDCPPITHCRLVVRERAWLRRLEVAERSEPAFGDRLALFSTEPDEPLDVAPGRQVRVAIAAILRQGAWDKA